MNVLVEIESTEVAVKEGTSQKTGKPYCIREQRAYLKLPHFKYPQEIKLPVPDELPSYAAGMYTLDTESFWVNEFKELKLGRVRLKPATTSTSSRAMPMAQQAARG
ncbi:hypothetical protein AXE65_06250 [Ventosimonas gracilis]|uniref:Single-stranded DNA-binding protein n=1 Tax=Ventosimonas gracilis TaxID=1680762 RepID=A0A139SM03_9GAMM|nr:single-stranded DNA-binding protein [Ventosimonas gracilis]KXU35586.1 hypothetical protein AXE65_06250 [Ventosimonas gracilis]